MYVQYLLYEVRAPPGPLQVILCPLLTVVVCLSSPGPQQLPFETILLPPCGFISSETRSHPSRREGERNHYLVGFENEKVKINYIDRPKVLEGIPGNEREKLKHEKINEDFGSLELAGRNMKKKNEKKR